jgi:hypothetical protein
LIQPDPGKTVRYAQNRQKVKYDQHSKPNNFSIGDEVWVRSYAAPEKWSTGKVVEETRPVSAKIAMEDSRVVRRHHDQIRWQTPIRSETTEESSESTVEESGETAVEESGETAVEESGETAVEESGETAVEESGETAVEESGETAVEESGETAVEESGETAVEESGDSERRYPTRQHRIPQKLNDYIM